MLFMHFTIELKPVKMQRKICEIPCDKKTPGKKPVNFAQPVNFEKIFKIQDPVKKNCD